MTERETMEAMDLEKLFRPRSIAVVRASEDFTSIGGKPLRNLIGHGYEVAIYSVETSLRIGGFPSLSILMAKLEGSRCVRLWIRL